MTERDTEKGLGLRDTNNWIKTEKVSLMKTNSRMMGQRHNRNRKDGLAENHF